MRLVLTESRKQQTSEYIFGQLVCERYWQRFEAFCEQQFEALDCEKQIFIFSGEKTLKPSQSDINDMLNKLPSIRLRPHSGVQVL